MICNESIQYNHGSFRNKFTQEEDNMIKHIVDNLKISKWSQVASMIPGRTPKQCRDRYRNYLSPGIENKTWSPEEDMLLVEKVQEMGHKWTEMVPFFNGRGSNNIKNRWHKFLSKSYPQDILPLQNNIKKSIRIAHFNTYNHQNDNSIYDDSYFNQFIQDDLFPDFEPELPL